MLNLQLRDEFKGQQRVIPTGEPFEQITDLPSATGGHEFDAFVMCDAGFPHHLEN